MSEERPPGHDSGFLPGLLLVIAVFILVAAMAPGLQRWYACQQLAPIERLFVRGC